MAIDQKMMIPLSISAQNPIISSITTTGVPDKPSAISRSASRNMSVPREIRNVTPHEMRYPVLGPLDSR
jgi:hypothetical protein